MIRKPVLKYVVLGLLILVFGSLSTLLILSWRENNRINIKAASDRALYTKDLDMLEKSLTKMVDTYQASYKVLNRIQTDNEQMFDTLLQQQEQNRQLLRQNIALKEQLKFVQPIIIPPYPYFQYPPPGKRTFVSIN